MSQVIKETDFVVRENKTLSAVVGSVFLLMFATSLLDFSGDEKPEFHFKAMYLTIVPAVFFLVKAFSHNHGIIRVNRQGFFYYGKLLTDWDHFVSAKLSQKQDAGDIQDKFVLLLQYSKDDGLVYQRTIPLTNTQDKAEEEVVAAIRHFKDLHNPATAPNTTN